MTCGEPARVLCHTSGGELEQIQFLLGHASVQTTERYLGCKQNLGHPVNDLFDLAKNGRPFESDVESARSKASDSVEMASRQGIECRDGGSSHDQSICDSRPLSLPKRTDLVEVREGHRAARAFLTLLCSGNCTRVIQEAKEMANQDQGAGGSVGPGTLPYLTERRKGINRKYEYRQAQLTHVFGRLLHEKRLSEEELRGLGEDKLKSIRSCAKFLAEDAA